MEPAVFFGTFDLIALILLSLLNVGLWKLHKLDRISPNVVAGWLLLFGLIMPFASAFNEARNYQECIIMTDPKELLYISFRFPLWWLIGIAQFLVMMYVLVPLRRDTKPDTRISSPGV
jgi:hypothetical protein